MNQKKLAALLGVSHSTVSAAFSGKGRVSDKTRARVLELAREHRYHPSLNIEAQQMVRRRHGGDSVFRRIGLLWPMDPGVSQRHPFLSKVLQGILLECDRSGYSVELVNEAGHREVKRGEGSTSSREVPGTEPVRRPFKASDFRLMEGMILVFRVVKGLEELMMRSCPKVVCVNMDCAMPKAAAVNVDNGAVMAAAAGHLHRLGHRHVVLTGAAESRETLYLSHQALGRRLQELEEGCRSEMVAVDGPFPEEHDQERWWRQLGERSLERMLQRSLDQPVAVVFQNEGMALGAMAAALRRGIDVPGKISLMGIGNLSRPAETGIGLTTVDLGLEKMGELAVRAILDHPATSFPSLKILCDTVCVVERGSVANLRESLAAMV